MKIDKLKPGAVVYSVRRHKMGNTNISTVGIWNVLITAVDEAAGVVTASVNGNPTRSYRERDWSKWKAKKPELIATGFGGHRLAKKGAEAT